ncbi:hypothetical protein XELAEV_18040787mg [Xenopus laevis]|uniref:Apolipoprotein C-I n=1 Tax=Xenopus laevis TaxID=8355 RepID=A0A974CAB9_XENLA|nr:hypothetical protein XELAEV_18040787mg [Xenopus laevis]
MKVLALVVLVIAISGMEAGVVKREVPNLDEFTKIFSSWADTLKTQTQEWIAKIQNGEVKAQTEEIFAQVKTQMEPLQGHFQELFSQFTDKKA